jgi:hypothetical protein
MKPVNVYYFWKNQQKIRSKLNDSHQNLEVLCSVNDENGIKMEFKSIFSSFVKIIVFSTSILYENLKILKKEEICKKDRGEEERGPKRGEHL